jgi:hypothetical protein
MFRARGRAFFEEILPVLKLWARTFTNAKVNSDLAQKVMEAMEVATDNVRRNQGETAPQVGPVNQLPASQDLSSGLDNTGVRSSTAATSSNSTSTPVGLVGSGISRLRSSINDLQVGRASRSQSLNLNDEDNEATAAQGLTELSSYTPAASNANQVVESTPMDIIEDPVTEDLSNFDLFPYFDESFDLGQVDFLFDLNLDPMHPVLWQGQQADGGPRE